MVVTNIVRLSDLEGAKRIDSEYYRKDFLDLRGIIQKSQFKVIKLGNIIEKGYRVVYWSTKIIPRQEMMDKDVFFLQAANLDEAFPFIRAEDMGGVWHKDWEEYPDGRIIPRELLVEVKGKAEKVTLVPDDFPRKTLVSGSLYKLSVRPDIEPEYVLVYLLTKFGKGFRDRLKTNLLVAFVNKKDLHNIPIVILSPESRKKVKELYLSAYGEFKKSKNLYFQAENLLLEKLGLRNFKLNYELSYTANLSKAFEVHRIDSEYFQPIYEETIKQIGNKFKIEKLGKLSSRIRIKMKPDSEQIYKYIEISDVSTDVGEIHYTERVGNQLPPNARIPINGGELIISKVRPTRGAIGIIPKELNKNVICSSAFSVFTTKSPMIEYLYVVTRSLVGKLQMERPTTGTSYPTINDSDIETMIIPILSPGTQKEIASLVQLSCVARKKATKLLEVAKRKIEDTIENV